MERKISCSNPHCSPMWYLYIETGFAHGNPNTERGSINPGKEQQPRETLPLDFSMVNRRAAMGPAKGIAESSRSVILNMVHPLSYQLYKPLPLAVSLAIGSQKKVVLTIKFLLKYQTLWGLEKKMSV